ncbi:SOS response-associated peptidase [Marinoscillum sp. MHG1-6]|uniref:SOS response-associated peptidase n=1 Tax=Marinoscillum sp. MHG1-6 TaxID=2959627 RepID=UPI002156FF59|nr:SOS response-associated peptidase [Marinoscillum sp. MHG1-6]
MFDRYTVGFSPETIEKVLGKNVEEPFEPTYNAAPTQKLPVVTNTSPEAVQLYYWGLSSKLSNNKSISKRLFNLASDAALGRPMYRKILGTNRCWILTDGLYVWKQVSKKIQTPYYFHRPNKEPMIIAGVYEEFEEFDGSVSNSFNMITVPTKAPLIGYSEDAPALLDEKQAESWLDPALEFEELESILNNINLKELTFYSVSPMINNLNLTGASLIEPSQPSDQHGNYTLF